MQVMRDVRRRLADDGGPGWVPLGLVVGVLAGVLIAAIVLPRQQGRVVTAGRSGATADGPGESSAPGTATGGVPVGSAPGAGSSSAAAAATSGGRAAQAGKGGAQAGVAGSTQDAGSTATSRGVTATTIKLGIAVIDLSALKALGPQYDPGDIQKQWEAMLDDWKRRGQLPIGGRTIEFVFKTYNVLSSEEQRAACVSLAQDEAVFAVIAVTGFNSGAECVTREFRTPLLTLSAPDETMYQRGWPFLFSLDWSQDRTFRNFVHWAERRGLLTNKTIGIYAPNDAVTQQVVAKSLKGELAKLGHSVAVEAATDQSFGGPQDALAVQQFRAKSVDLAIILTSKSGFMQQAKAQGYRPTYLESDFGAGTSDVIAASNPADQFDGTYGVTGQTRGETASGIPLSAAQEACIGIYERYSGRTVARPKKEQAESNAEFAYVQNSCDEGKALLIALNAAGRNLRPLTFVAGLESMRSVAMLRSAHLVSFSPSRHDGTDVQRTLQWQAGCACWKALGQFAPLFSP